jgi:branched-chain amino acid transport system permease protein
MEHPPPATPRLWPWAVATVLALVAPWVFGSGLGLNVLAQVAIAAIACLSYNLLLGYGGMLGFGHAIFTGAGAYAAIHLLRAAAAQGWPLPVSALPLLGGVAGLACAALAGLVLTRRAGTTFAMITLGLGELVYAAALMFPQWSGGEAGVSGNRVLGAAVLGADFGPARQIYYLAALYALGSAALLYLFNGTALGRLLQAVRDNAERVEFLGFSARWIRYRALLVAGFFAGIAGGLAALLFEIVTPEVFSPLRSGSYLLFTFLGGTAWFLGPVLGAVLMVLATVLLSGWTPAWLLYLGLLFMGAVVLAPQGLAGVVGCMVRSWQVQGARRVLPRWLLLGASAAVALAGGVALVEMLYHRQLGDVLGPQFLFLGLVTMDVAQPGYWAVAAASAVAGAVLWRHLQRRLAPLEAAA